MKSIDYDRLIYRRQFLLVPEGVTGPEGWERHVICNGKKMLYVHPDLDYCEFEKDGKRAVLLGYIFDWQRPQDTDLDILRRLICAKGGFDELLRATFDFSGRFALIYEDESTCRLFHDAAGQREVYYHVGESGVSCGSQLPILKQYLSLEDNPDREVCEFYVSKDFINSKKNWFGDFTIYKDTRGLKPNFYLDLIEGCAVRYWPTEPLEPKSLDWAVEIGSNMLCGFMDAASRRKSLVLPVTAGWDSRVTLAATRKISSKVDYFIIKFSRMDERHVDIRIPKKLFKKLGIPFNVMDASAPIDEKFADIFRQNAAYPKEENLPGIYNVLYSSYEGRVNMPGHVSDIVKNYRGKIELPTGELFSGHVGYDCANKFAAKTCDLWLEDTKELARKMNIDLLSLFYWEETINSQASQRTESDIAVDEYCVFSCRNLLANLLSVDSVYRGKFNCVLYRKMMERMWPQVLSEPMNPSLHSYIRGVLSSLNLLYPLKELKKKLLR